MMRNKWILRCFIVVLFDDPGSNKAERAQLDENHIILAIYYFI